ERPDRIARGWACRDLRPRRSGTPRLRRRVRLARQIDAFERLRQRQRQRRLGSTGGLAERDLVQRGALERRELDRVTRLVVLSCLLDALLGRTAHQPAALHALTRTAPRHQRSSPTVAGSPRSNRTSPSPKTGP